MCMAAVLLKIYSAFSIHSFWKFWPLTKVDYEELRAILEADPLQTTSELAVSHGVSDKTVVLHLKQILAKWKNLIRRRADKKYIETKRLLCFFTEPAQYEEILNRMLDLWWKVIAVQYSEILISMAELWRTPFKSWLRRKFTQKKIVWKRLVTASFYGFLISG